MNENRLNPYAATLLAVFLAACNMPGNTPPTQTEGASTNTLPPPVLPTEATLPPTATLIPTQTLEPIPTQTLLEYDSEMWTGELPFNNLGVSSENMVRNMMAGLGGRGLDRGKTPSRLDSTFTSLTNPFSPQLFGVDPLTEPGFGDPAINLNNFFDVKGVITNRSMLTLSELLTLNENGIVTTKVVGQEDDHDAALAILAVEKAFISHKLKGFTGQNTLQEVFDNPEAVNVVEGIQEEMFKMIQKEFLTVSDKEEQDRSYDGGRGDVDASAGLPKDLQKPDQSTSCDVYRTPAETREGQLQALREVTHNVDVKEDTFTKANSSEEQTLWALSYDPATGKWKVGAFTSRAYSGPIAGQENSASGDQKFPCGPGERKTGSGSEKPKEEEHEKGPDTGNSDGGRGSDPTDNPGTGTNEH